MENPAGGAARSININPVLVHRRSQVFCIPSDYILHFHGA